jgi:hypothetical protein
LCALLFASNSEFMFDVEKWQKRRNPKQWCSSNAFFINRHYRLLQQLAGHNIFSMRREWMNICMSSNWFACHFIESTNPLMLGWY